MHPQMTHPLKNIGKNATKNVVRATGKEIPAIIK
jgi:hypothetical protein